jgi:hypothetical protein
VQSTEAGLKYFVLGALSSGMLLRLLADLRLGNVVRRHRQGVGAGRHRSDLWSHLLFAGLLQGSAVPFTWDAGRLRWRADAGDGILRRRPQDCRHGDFRPRHHQRVPGITLQWQQIVVFVAIA